MLWLMLWVISQVPLYLLQVISQSLSRTLLLSPLHIFVNAGRMKDMIFHLFDT